MLRKIRVEMIKMNEILLKPFFLNEKLSLRVIMSSPRKKRIRGLRISATGTRDAAFIPMIPSDSQSTDSPVAKARSMHAGVLTLRGTQITIAGSIVSMTNGLKSAKLQRTICPSTIRK
jgi:hypothetical protein